MTEQDRLFEKEKLSSVMFEIDKQIEENSLKVENYRKNQIEANKLMWDEVQDPTDIDDVALMKQYIDYIKVNARNREFYRQLVKRLKKMRQSAYFGRIDFKETKENIYEKIYIGISNLSNESGDILVYDWRAPISSMFYDYEIGAAQYESPIGIIEGEVALKRQYKIVDGKIEYMFDSNIKIDDEILQEILSKSVDNKMKTIVTTIQREQNRIIRDESHKLLLVQGPAGSGKTSIALHRVAFLLYRYRDTITADNIVIFSPNQVFSDYISNVLPELGEENTYRTTFYQYARKNIDKVYDIEDMNDQMEFLLSSKDDDKYKTRVDSIKLKVSEEFKVLLDKYILYLEKDGFKFSDLVFGNKIVLSKEEISELFSKDYKFFPIVQRIEKIKNRFNYILKPLEKERYEELLQELAGSGKYVEKKEIKARSRMIVKEEIEPLIESLNKMLYINVFDLYKQLFLKADLFKMLFNRELPANFMKVCEFTLESIESKVIYYEDIFPLLYLKGLLGEIPNLSHIKHVIIDEAQDYTILQFEIIKQMFPHCNITMLGDLCQSINPYFSIGTYDYITEIFKEDKKLSVKLNKTYRSTKEITAFCNAMLKEGMDIEYVNRPGNKPVIKKCDSTDIITRFIEEDLARIKKSGYRSVAIICRTDSESRELYRTMKKNLDIKLITKDDTKYSMGIVIVPSYLAKGLEFDKVIIFNAGNENYKDEQERSLFYTACTRALHELNIYYVGTITPFIYNISKDLYVEHD